MKTNLFIAAMSLLVLAGCSNNDDEISNIIANNENAITFDTYVGKATKASILNVDALQGQSIGVFAYYNETTLDMATAIPNFMYNQEVKYTSNAWTYSPVKYWPENEKAINFYSYSPLQATVSEQTTPGYPTVDFTQEDAVANQIDFVYAVNEGLKSGKIDLAFKHALSRIAFAAKPDKDYQDGGKYSDETGTYITVTAISVKAENIIKTGKLTFSSAGAAMATSGVTMHAGSWDILTNGNQPLYTDEAAYSSTASWPITPNDGYLMLIPQTIAANTIKATVSYKVETFDAAVGGKVTITNNSKEVDLPAVTLESGKAYKINLLIGLNKIEVGTININSWGTETEE